MNFNKEYKNRFRIVKGGLISLVVSSYLYGAPSGGTVTSGNANISKSGNITNIDQSSDKAIINWKDFSIKNNETVNFNQPNKNSITLNRVIGNEKSIIDGALNANGQVWLLNSKGTVFGKNAKINTAGLLVTTKELSDDDFNKGNYNFKGKSKESIENNADIVLQDKAYAAFVANSVINNGKIEIHRGTIHLVGAEDVTISLNDNSLISLKVNKGAMDALVENNHMIIANGGNVYLTTNAKNEMLRGVINQKGIIRAASLDDIQSEVIIFAHGGTANIDGTVEAKGSFVETSGENLSVKDSFKIKAKTWLLDPTNITIEANGTTDVGDVNSSSGDVSVSANAIQNALAGTDVLLQADNNITVNENITWNQATQLKLTADSINVNATINNTNSTNGGVFFNASNAKNKVVFGVNGKVIVNNINQMQWINTALMGRYELGSNIDASATLGWDGGAGFKPIGNMSNSFSGTFDGKGFTISNLSINRPATESVGLFGYATNATIRNTGLIDVNISGFSNVGGLIGTAGYIGYSNKDFTLVENSYATGNVKGNKRVGGLIGKAENVRLNNSYADVNIVNSYDNVGGLVGYSHISVIKNSYAIGDVKGQDDVGGLVGYSDHDKIENSYATGNVTGLRRIGGLIGHSYFSNSIKDSYATGNVSGTLEDIGGLIGKTIYSHINNSYATGNVEGKEHIGGFIGTNVGNNLL